MRALTLHQCSPLTITSPVLRVPWRTITVEVAPLPCSSWLSIITPSTGAFGFALSSMISACNSTSSRSLSIFSPFRAEIGVQSTSPPQSSEVIPRFCICCFTRSIFAPLASILFMATTIGTPAFWAKLSASSVWGIKPSSAATTRIAMSVTFAPLSLIFENAAWPGVSRKVIFLPLQVTWYAAVCCVIPPASPATTLVLRIVSRSVVFPWSTCPSMQTIGGRGT